MSSDTVALTRRAQDAFNRRDWDAFVAVMDEEIEAESRLAAVEGAYVGHDGLRRWWDDFLGVFPDYTIEIGELRDLGDAVLAHLHAVGHGTASATPVIDPVWQPTLWRNGKCVWWRVCATEREALEAIARRRAARSG